LVREADWLRAGHRDSANRLARAQHGDRQDAAPARGARRIADLVLRVLLNVGALRRRARHDGPADHAAPGGAQRKQAPRDLFRLGLQGLHAGAPDQLSVKGVDQPLVPAAEASRIQRDRIEHRLQIGLRAAYDVENLPGRGLALERLARLVEQAHVVDRNDRLMGKRRKQLDVVVAELAGLAARHGNGPDRFAFAQHGHRN